MYLSYGTVFVLLAGAAIVWFWQDGLRARDLANSAAMRACADLQLQFLDGTAAFSRLRLVRDVGQLRLQRTFVFDYTAQSMERLQGFVVLTGWRVDSVGFARQTPITAPEFRPETPPESHGSITRIDDWRRR
jgi:hypothetical protein